MYHTKKIGSKASINGRNASTPNGFWMPESLTASPGAIAKRPVSRSRLTTENHPTMPHRPDTSLPSGQYKGIRMKFITGPTNKVVFESHGHGIRQGQSTGAGNDPVNGILSRQDMDHGTECAAEEEPAYRVGGAAGSHHTADDSARHPDDGEA